MTDSTTATLMSTAVGPTTTRTGDRRDVPTHTTILMCASRYSSPGIPAAHRMKGGGMESQQMWRGGRGQRFEPTAAEGVETGWQPGGCEYGEEGENMASVEEHPDDERGGANLALPHFYCIVHVALYM